MNRLVSAGWLNSASSWTKAARPRTLSLAVSPVLVGTSLVWAAERKTYVFASLVAAFASMCIQLGTNLHNDVADSELGGDGPERLGPLRVTTSGLLSARAVKCGAYLCFTMAAALGLYLVSVGGWPILLLGLLSILSGWTYTGGPMPIAYTPFGEAFVLAFFGVGAVCGTYWLVATKLTAAALTGGLAIGLFASAVLLVNNTRDVKDDARVGRRTFAIVAGRPNVNLAYAAMVLAPFVLLLPIGHWLPHGHIWPAFAAFPFAAILCYRFLCEPGGRGFNRLLVQTVQLQLLYSILLCVGLWS